MNIKQIRNAEIITEPTSYWVFTDDESVGNEGYFELNDIDDHFESEDEKPCFVWNCTEDKWKGIDIDSVLESEFEDWYDGAADQISHYDELITFIKNWNAKQCVRQYFPDYSKIIVLNAEKFKQLIGE